MTEPNAANAVRNTEGVLVIGIAVVMTLTLAWIPPGPEPDVRVVPDFDLAVIDEVEARRAELAARYPRRHHKVFAPLYYVRKDFSEEIAQSVDDVR